MVVESQGHTPTLTLSHNTLWVKNRDSWVALEVVNIEGDHAGNPMNIHCGDKTRIVNFEAGDLVH